jgi:membrane-bound lytic murein transglycosylase D
MICRFKITRIKAVSFLGLAFLAFACSSGPRKLEKVSLTAEQADILIHKDATHSDFPIEIPAPVLREINILLETEVSRKILSEEISRMHSLEPQIISILKEAHLPLELLAIPLVQTGYQNRAPEKHSDGAGYWRFTQFTANLYGLVTADLPEEPLSIATDQRLDLQKETQAATIYLGHLYRLFKNWDFALTAYCEGENFVFREQEKDPSLTAWQMESDALAEKPCLTETMAVLVVIKYPYLLRYK